MIDLALSDQERFLKLSVSEVSQLQESNLVTCIKKKYHFEINYTFNKTS